MNKKFRQNNAFGYAPKKAPEIKFIECRICKKSLVLGGSHFKTHKLDWQNYTLTRTVAGGIPMDDFDPPQRI